MKRASDLLKEAGLIELWQPQQTTDEVELAFLARQLVQITLPHSDPGDVPVWTRRNGDFPQLSCAISAFREMKR